MAIALDSPAEQASRAERDPSSRWERVPWALVAVVALGAAIRFSTLGEQSFWYDEAITHGIVAHGLGHVFATIPKTESTPPLYYVLAWLWARAFGAGEVGLRSLSALCGTATIAVVWEIGRRLVSERVGLIAAMLAAVNPLLFWYSQEARSYALLLLLSTLTLLAMLLALEQPSARRLATWGLTCAAALVTHYFAAVMIAPEGLWLAFALHGRGHLTARRVAAGATPIVVTAVALLPLMIRQNDGRASYISEYSGSLGYRLGQLVKEDILGDGQPLKVLLFAIGCVLVLLSCALLVRLGDRRARAGAAIMLALGGSGVLLALLVSATVSDYFNTRNLLASWPALALFVACGLATARARRLGNLATAGLAVLGLICIFNVIRDTNLQRDDWRGAARALGAATSARAIVADSISEPPLAVYLPRLGTYPGAGIPLTEVDLVWLGRGRPWAPLIPIRPRPLAGFPSIRVLRTSTYLVVRYRSAHPIFEQPAALDRLYPVLPRGLVLLQRP